MEREILRVTTFFSVTKDTKHYACVLLIVNIVDGSNINCYEIKKKKYSSIDYILDIPFSETSSPCNL